MLTSLFQCYNIRTNMRWTGKVFKVGNSLAVTIPSELCRMHNIEAGDKFEAKTHEGGFVLESVNVKKWDDGYRKWLKGFREEYISEINDLSSKKKK